MNATVTVRAAVGLNRALKLCGVSKKAWYYTPRKREEPPNPELVSAVREAAERRPAYGTRRMAAQLSRELGVPVNRKTVQRIYRILEWNTPSRTKREIIRSNRKVPRPDGPNRFWESDMTYIWCGADGWRYCFNVLDVFTREWLAYVLAADAKRHHAIMAVNNAVAEAGPPADGLTLRVDNGTQYTSRDFRASMSDLGIKLEYIYVNTPEQNGHIESFHKTLKKEYVWPREFADTKEAGEALKEAFRDYNHSRIHSSIGYRTPAEFAAMWEREHGDRRGGKDITGGEKCA